MHQFSFEFLKDYKKTFGGELLQGKRKSKRPLSTKQPVHIVLKSEKFVKENLAPDSEQDEKCRLFDPRDLALENIIRTQAVKYQITLYDLALVWNHIHMAVRIPSKKSYLAFIRTVTANIIIYLSKKIDVSVKGLFDLRPFTRVLSWGREYKKLLEYILKNRLEALGLVKKTARRKKRKTRAKTSSA